MTDVLHTDTEPNEQLRAELAAERMRADNLERAIDSNRRIGMAVGILMTRRQLDAEQAFELLVAVSQSAHTKLRQVAEHVVYTGTVDTLPALVSWQARQRRRESGSS